MRTLTILLASLAGLPAAAQDWPQFRGPGGRGASDEEKFPLEWSPDKNVRWRAALPGAANSSPIVSKGIVFVTAAEGKGKKRHLVALDRKTGKALWTRTVEHAPAEPTHEENPTCGSTPCADGERVVVWHSSAGLHCYDFQGKPLWSRDLGAFAHMWGYGASPVLHQGRVFLNCGPGARTFLTALDAKTGKTLWQADEPGAAADKWVGSWATPRVLEVEGKDQVVVPFPGRVKAFDPETGKVLWQVEGLGQLAYSDVLVGGGIGIATGEDEAGNCVGFRLGGKGDTTATHRLWSRARPLEVMTGVLLEGRLWTVDNGGILRCTEAETGKELFAERAPRGPAWGSMVVAAKRVYYTSRSGETVVFRPGAKGIETLAVNSLGEKSNATPAFSEGEIFLRTNQAAYCISESR